MLKNRVLKAVALGLASILSLGLLAACGGNGTTTQKTDANTTTGQSSAEEVTISFGIWDEKQRPAMEEMIAAYNVQKPNVKVQIQLTPYREYWTKLEASAVGGTAPDVFWLNVLHLDSYLEGQILLDISDAVAGSDLQTAIPENLINNYIRNDKNYAVPKDFDTNALWYNKGLFDAAGVAYPTDDMTYDDFMALAEELKDKLPEGVFPFASPVDFQTWYYRSGY